MTARRRRAMEKLVRSRVSRAKAIRRHARGTGVRRTATAAAAAAVGLAGGSLVAGASPAQAATHTGLAQAATSASLKATCTAPTPGSEPSDSVVMGSTLFFTADDGVHGRELWKSDGTRAGTVLVKDIHPGAGKGGDYYYYGGDEGSSSLTVVGNTLFFTADDGVHGTELWKSDGTRAGTVMVRDVHPGRGNSYYDGPNSLTAVGNTLFFTEDDGKHGQELWKSNGTKAGTALVKDITPGSGSSYDGEGGPQYLTEFQGKLFFTADDGQTGQELWMSDGSTAGTVMVKDVNPGAYGSADAALTAVGPNLFFTARDGVHGRELWKTDGTGVGTVLVKDTHPGIGRYYTSPRSLTNVAGTLFFTADDGDHGRELWTSDGSPGGTAMVKDVNPTSSGYYSGPYDLAGVAGTVYFTEDDGTNGRELWKSDGSEGGTVLVKDIFPGGYDSDASDLTNVDGTLFFTARDGQNGRELWKSDGSGAGTVLVKNIHPGTGGYYDGPNNLVAGAVPGTLFLSADDGTHGQELWKSDGTDAGTVQVKDINAGGAFRVASQGRADTSRGTVTVKVATAGAGTLVVRPAAGSELRKTVRVVADAGTTKITLKPTRAGLRILRHNGSLRVKAKFTFTPCGGTGSSVVRQFTLRLR